MINSAIARLNKSPQLEKFINIIVESNFHFNIEKCMEIYGKSVFIGDENKNIYVKYVYNNVTICHNCIYFVNNGKCACDPVKNVAVHADVSLIKAFRLFPEVTINTISSGYSIRIRNPKKRTINKSMSKEIFAQRKKLYTNYDIKIDLGEYVFEAHRSMLEEFGGEVFKHALATKDFNGVSALMKNFSKGAIKLFLSFLYYNIRPKISNLEDAYHFAIAIENDLFKKFCINALIESNCQATLNKLCITDTE